MLSKISYFQKKLRKLLAIIAVFCFIAFTSQVQALPHILLKGLFKALKNDDIGFAHALLHSRWIENLYQYGAGAPHKNVKIKKGKDTTWKTQEGKDAVANLIRRFWFRKKESHLLMPTQFGCLAKIPNDQWGRMFGMLMNYVYRGCGQMEETVLLDTIFSYDPQAQQFEQDLDEHRKLLSVEKEKLENEKFDLVKQAYQELKAKRSLLEKHYNMGLFKEEIAHAKKKLKGKALTKEKQRLKEKYDKAKYVAALKKAKREIFIKVSQELQDEYDEIVRKKKKLEVKVNKKLSQKRDLVRRTVCDPIRKSLEFCNREKTYAPRTTESILWALFFHRLDCFIFEKTKLQAINDCLACIEPEFKAKEFSGMLQDFYTKEELERFGEKILSLSADKQSQQLLENYDLALHYLLHLAVGALPPVVTQGKFGYEYESGKISHFRPNCHETAILDLFSVLWHDPQKREYNNTLFSENIIKNGEGFKKLREVLKYFYLADCKGIQVEEYMCEHEGRKFTSFEKLKSLGIITIQEVEQLDISEVPVEYINRSEVKQEFFNIVAEIPGIFYRSKVEGKEPVFEIRSNPQNVLNICNYFYGTSAETIDELTGRDTGLSTESRIVAFRKKNKQDSIRVSVECKNNSELNLVVKIGETHTSLVVFDREKKASCVLSKGVAKNILQKMVQLSGSKRERLSSLFTLLNSQELLKSKMLAGQLPMLQLLFYSQIMKKGKVKLALLKEILTKYPHYYESCKEVIHNLIKKFPKNNQELKVKLAELIIKTGFYKYKFFQHFIKFNVLNDLRLYNNADRVSDLLWACLDHGYKKLAQEIIKHPCFDSFNHALLVALEQENQELVLEIIDNPKFNARAKEVKIILNGLLVKGYRKAALAIVNNPQFNPNFKGVGRFLKKVLECGYPEVAIAILNNPKFRGNYKGIVDILNLAIKCGYAGVVFAMMSYPGNRDFNEDIIKPMLEKRCIETAFGFVGNLKLELEGDFGVADILTQLLEIGHKNIVIEILQSHTFSVLFNGVGVFLKGALESGHLDIVLAIVESPNFRVDFPEAMNLLRLALQKGHKNIVLGIVTHPTFYTSFEKVGKVLLLLFQQEGYEDLVLELLEHPCFRDRLENEENGVIHVGREYKNLGGRHLIELLPLAIEKKNQKLALAIVKHPRFVFNYTCIKDILKQALKQGYATVALEIVKNPEFYVDSGKIRKLLVQLLQEKTYPEVAAAIINHDRFGQWEWKKAFAFALEQGYKHVAKEMMNHPRFDAWGCVLELALKQDDQELVKEITSHLRCDMGKAGEALEVALEKGHIKIAEAIVSSPTFEAKGYYIQDAIKIVFQKGYTDIAQKIIRNPRFDVVIWGSALKAALEYGHTQMALEIVKNSNFRVKGRLQGECLVLSLQDEKYQEVAKELMKTPKLDKVWGCALGYALKKGYGVIAKDMIKKLPADFNSDDLGFSSMQERMNRWNDDKFDHWAYTLRQILKRGCEQAALEITKRPEFKADFKDVGYVLKDALKKEYKDVALAIVKHPTFKIDEYSYGIGDAWVLALVNDQYHEIAFKIMKMPGFEPDADAVGRAIVLFLKNEKYREIAIKVMDKIVIDKRFRSDHAWGHALKFALKKGYKDIVDMIVSHPKFDGESWQAGEALILVLRNKQYKDIAQKIMDHPNFNGWGYALANLLEEEYIYDDEEDVEGFYKKPKKIAPDPEQAEENRIMALEIMSNHKFHVDCHGIGRALHAALKNPVYKEIALKIGIDSALQVDGVEMENALFWALKQGHTKIANNIMNNPMFERWGLALKKATNKPEDREIALVILTHPKFNATKFGAGRALMHALENKDKQLAEAIINHPTFFKTRRFSWLDHALALAVKEKYKEIALKLAKKIDRYGFSGTLGDTLDFALEYAELDSEFLDIAAEVMKNAWNFAQGSDVWGSKLLGYIQQIIDIDPTREQELQPAKEGIERALEVYHERRRGQMDEDTDDEDTDDEEEEEGEEGGALRQAPLIGLGTQQDDRDHLETALRQAQDDREEVEEEGEDEADLQQIELILNGENQE